MVAENTKKHPIILWAQRDNVLFLTIEVEDMKIEKLTCEGTNFLISGTNGSGTAYEASLELFASIKGNERRQIETARQVELVFPKEKTEWWPRLLKEAIKVPWLKVDFNKWVDEDDVAEDAGGAGFDFSNMNFPGANMLGGMGGDEPEDESGSDEEDEANSGMPPLDDIEAEKPTASSSSS